MTVGARGGSRKGRQIVSMVMLLGLALLQPVAGTRAPVGSPEVSGVARLEGSGIAAKLACVGCAGAIVGVSGGSIGGAILMATLHPEFFGGCAFLCYEAFS